MKGEAGYCVSDTPFRLRAHLVGDFFVMVLILLPHLREQTPEQNQNQALNSPHDLHSQKAGR
jgi:hypothetical protein